MGLLLAAAGCASTGSSEPRWREQAAASSNTATVIGNDAFRFTPSRVTAKAGDMTLRLVASGSYPHNLSPPELHKTSATVGTAPSATRDTTSDGLHDAASRRLPLHLHVPQQGRHDRRARRPVGDERSPAPERNHSEAQPAHQERVGPDGSRTHRHRLRRQQLRRSARTPRANSAPSSSSSAATSAVTDTAAASCAQVSTRCCVSTSTSRRSSCRTSSSRAASTTRRSRARSPRCSRTPTTSATRSVSSTATPRRSSSSTCGTRTSGSS